MKRRQNGSFTIEAAVIVPVILMMFVILIYVFFYYHDKNILSGAAYETAVVGSERGESKSEALGNYFQKRIRGKLIFFGNVQEEILVEEEKVTVSCRAYRRGMRVRASASAKITSPEKYIRNVRKIEKLGEKLGENE